MKRKELKRIAEKIAKNEKIIQNGKDMKQKMEAEANIMKLSEQLENIEDILKVDELVQEILKKN